MALRDLLDEIKEEYGIDEFGRMLIEEPTRVSAIMSDSRRNDSSIVPFVLDAMVSDKILGSIVNGRGKANADDIVNMCIDEFVRKGIQKEIVTEYVYAFADVFELKYSKKAITNNSSPSENTNIGNVRNSSSKGGRINVNSSTKSDRIDENSAQRNSNFSRRTVIIYVVAAVIFIALVAGGIGFARRVSEKRKLQELEDICVAYKEGSLSYEDALDQINLVEVDVSSAEQRKAEIEALYKSRESYETAERYVTTNDYPEAVKYYGMVIETDSNYTQAQNNIDKYTDVFVTNVLEKSHLAGEAGDLEGAKRIIEDANGQLKLDEFESEIKVLKSQIEEKQREEEKQQVEVEMQQYLNEGDYKQAVVLYKKYSGIIGDEIKAEYEKKLDEYVNNQIEQAKNKYFEKYEVEDALSIMKKLQSDIGVRTEISKCINVLESAKDLPLSQMTITNSYAGGDYSAAGNSWAVDKLGNRRDTAIIYRAWEPNYVQFKCEGYDRVSFLVVPSKSWDPSWKTAAFFVAGLDSNGTEKKLYSSSVFTKNSEFEWVSIDLQGSSQFKIYGGLDYGACRFLFDNMCLKKILTEEDFNF